jgi:hypothetical protein
MKIISSSEIHLSTEDIQDLIVKGLYDSQGITGISDIKFVIDRRFFTADNPNNSDYYFVFNGANIRIYQNEK